MRRALLLLLCLAPPAGAGDLLERLQIREKAIGKDDYGRTRLAVVATLAPVRYFHAPLAQLRISPGGGGGSMAVGGALTGGTDTRVLFDDAGTLGEDAGFTYNKTTDTIALAGGVLAGNGLTSAPAYSFSAAAGSGMYRGGAANGVYLSHISNTWFGVDTTRGAYAIGAIGIGTAVETNVDTALKRVAANEAGISDIALTGLGYLYHGSKVNAVTTTATTSVLTTGTGCNALITNTGDADGSTITLMNDPTAGCFWRFGVTAAQTVTIVASTGETLKHGTSTCGTSLTSNAVGSTIEIWVVIGGSGGSMYTFGATGTWTCNA